MSLLLLSSFVVEQLTRVNSTAQFLRLRNIAEVLLALKQHLRSAHMLCSLTPEGRQLARSQARIFHVVQEIAWIRRIRASPPPGTIPSLRAGPSERTGMPNGD